MHTYINAYVHIWCQTKAQRSAQSEQHSAPAWKIHTYIHACMHTYIHTCMMPDQSPKECTVWAEVQNIGASVCIYTVCMCVCVYVHTVYMWNLTWLFRPKPKGVHSLSNIVPLLETCIHTYIQACIQTYIHIWCQTKAQRSAQSEQHSAAAWKAQGPKNIGGHSRDHQRTQVRLYTCIYTYMHTYMCECACVCVWGVQGSAKIGRHSRDYQGTQVRLYTYIHMCACVQE